MNKTILTGQLGGMPLTQDVLAFMQASYVGAIGAIARAFGSRVIVSGVADNGTSWGDGWIVIDGELMPFRGGLKGAYLVVQQAVQNDIFEDEVERPLYYEKYAQCGIAGDILFSTLVRIDTWADISRNLSNLITAHNELRVEFDGHSHSWDQITGKPNFLMPVRWGRIALGDVPGELVRTVAIDPLPDNNYYVVGSIIGLSTNFTRDNDTIVTYRNLQSGSFQAVFSETISDTQNIRFDYLIYRLQ